MLLTYDIMHKCVSTSLFLEAPFLAEIAFMVLDNMEGSVI
jgi:hypothetical protein